MSVTSIEDILMRVAGPSRYLGCEINTVRKDPAAVALQVALAFPDAYEIGTSHFGLQILYHILNREADIAAERVFAPGLDMAENLRTSGAPLFSLETRTPLSEFDILGFSLLYELNYTNVLLMLDLAGIPFFAADRGENHPLVIAGGPCTVNPEPVADFFDAMVVGDGEVVILEMARAAIAWKASGGGKRELLETWAKIEGVYIPSFFEPVYDEAGRQRLNPLLDGYTRVTRTIVENLDGAHFPDAPIIPFGRPVHDRIRLEVTRGCTRGCRFCQAGMIYRPVRERNLRNLADLAARSIAATGYEELSLLSLSTGDYSCLGPLMRHLIDTYADRRLAVSIPSFRAGTLSPEMMDLIRKIRKTGFTIAPEAGSERLRNVINKNINEDEIVDTVTSAFELGWQQIKLYFMIGLPTETDADLDAIADLAGRLKKIRRSGKRGGQITVSAATFIPKAHTPFQWVEQAGLDTAREKIEFLRRRLRTPGVQFKWQKPETSLLEGVFARGDRRLSKLLVAAYENGCVFDGWTDSFNFSAWKVAFDRTGIDPAGYSALYADPDAPLPWDHIDTRVTKAFLRAEYDRAIAAASTPDCRSGECQGCGVCDFERLAPRIAADDKEIELGDSAGKGTPLESGATERLKLVYRRFGRSRFYGHLELINIILRAIARARIPVTFSEGFHPKPKIAFGDALPVGTECLGEAFYLNVTGPVRTDRVREGLNQQLPEGLEILECRLVPPNAGPTRPETLAYAVRMEPALYDPACLALFNDAAAFPIRQRTKKGEEKTVNLKVQVREVLLLAPDWLWLRLENRPGEGIRPATVVREIFAIPEDRMQAGRIIKLPESTIPGTAVRIIESI